MAQAQDYAPQTIVVKFAKNSALNSQWSSSKRTCSFESFSPLLGEHHSRGYISSEIMTALNKRINRLSRSLQQSPAENLARIAIINYTNNIDALTAAKKISSQPGVEYAEPLYARHLVGVPNDSLLYKQYYLTQIKVYDAWDSLADTGSPVLVGIVDTGIDYLHEDIVGNIYVNPGESGLDSNNKDKSTNGIDDDGNGFIDDWHGWDFVGSDATAGDNDPMPGHEHGTHVGGTVGARVNNKKGIAGISRNVRLLPVKIAQDNPLSTSVYNSYEGVLYAATIGCKVINCSWGSTNKSQAEEEIINTAVDLGSVIVAAAGNDGDYLAFFPSAHPRVLSVAAVDWDDKKAYYSNYHNTVGVTAPGTDVFSTIPGNEYALLSGTSMASPVAAGVAALVCAKYPEYSPVQVIEHVKASSDNIDSLNEVYSELLGRGRVNAFRAVTETNLKSVVMTKYSIVNVKNKPEFEVGDTIEIEITVKNILSPLTNAKLIVGKQFPYPFSFLKDTFMLGSIGSMQELKVGEKLRFVVPGNLPQNYNTALRFMVYDDTVYCNNLFINATFRPTYKTMRGNDITVTFNNRGNLGFNDYPNNYQGDGFEYRNSPNILFEGALMIATAPNKMSDVARGLYQNSQDESFVSDETFIIEHPGAIAQWEGYTNFHDNNNDFEAGVAVKQRVYQFDDSLRRNFIILTYDIINTSGLIKDSLFAALYFDWDIGPSGSYNWASWDNQASLGFVKNERDDSLPEVGVLMLSPYKVNYFAVDNDAGYPLNPGVWDGFTNAEKWLMMSNGIYRSQSNVTDVSMVIGAGPLKLKSGDTSRVAFAIVAGKNVTELRNASRTARETAVASGIPVGKPTVIPDKSSILSLYPNPVDGNMVFLDFELSDGSNTTIEIFDILGRRIRTVLDNKFLSAGKIDFPIEIPVESLTSGTYFIQITTLKDKLVELFNIVR